MVLFFFADMPSAAAVNDMPLFAVFVFSCSVSKYMGHCDNKHASMLPLHFMNACHFNNLTLFALSWKRSVFLYLILFILVE